MPLKLRLEPNRRSFAFDHDYIFKSRSADPKALITRFRGTQCVPAEHGRIVTAWQKSIYRFGGIPLEETIVATILVRWDGTVHGLSLDERSHGGLGWLCNFRHMQQCMNRLMRGKRFSDFSRICPTAGDAQCLHLFEVLSAAASFHAHLEAQELLEGSEEELLRIYPGKRRIRVINNHCVLGQQRETELVLRHMAKPRTNLKCIPQEIDARLIISAAGKQESETVQAEDFRSLYGRLNRLLAKSARQEKDAFHVKGRMRFTNITALVGLLLLTISHESMHIMRSFRIERLLHELQAGGERATCIAFAALQKTYEPKKKK